VLRTAQMQEILKDSHFSKASGPNLFFHVKFRESVSKMESIKDFYTGFPIVTVKIASNLYLNYLRLFQSTS
jgi:hypothetical protein